MALVKKLNTGGSFSDYLRKTLPQDDISNGVSFDNLLREAETFTPNQVDTNESVGRRKRAAAKQNKLLNKYYKDYQTELSGNTTVHFNPQKDYNITNISDYISEQFGGNAEYAYSELSKLYGDKFNPSNDGIKAKLRDYMKDLSTNYINKANTSPEGNWTALQDVKALNDLTNQGDVTNPGTWATMVGLAGKLGWDVSPFLLADSDLDNIKNANLAIQAQESKEKENRDTNLLYNQLGISDPDLSNKLLSNGYTRTWGDDNNYLQKLRDKGFSFLQNSEGNHLVLKDGKLFEGSEAGLVTEDQFDLENYGDIYQIENGVYKRSKYDPNNKPANLNLNFDNLGLNIYGIRGSVNGEDYSDIRGSALSKDRVPVTDIFGRLDYRTSLTLHDKNTGQNIQLYRQPDGKYLTEEGTPYNQEIVLKSLAQNWGAAPEYASDYLNLSGWNNVKPVSPEIKKKSFWTKPLFSGIGGDIIPDSVLDSQNNEDSAPQETRETILQDIEDLQKKIKAARDSRTDLNVKKPEIDKIKGLLVHFMSKADKNQAELQKWIPLWKQMEEILNIEISPGKSLNSTLYQASKMAKGGILSLEQGGSSKSIFSKEYIDRRQADNTSTTPSSGKTAGKTRGQKINDITGTVRDMDALDAISLAGTALSFAPGIGIVGGLVSTAADAAKGFQEGWTGKDWANLGSNLAFTALAGVGLGSTKALAKGTQLATKATKASRGLARVSKVSNSLDNMGDLGKAAKQITSAQEAVNKSGKAVKILDIFGTNANKADKAMDALKSLDQTTKASLGITNKLESLDDARKAFGKSKEALDVIGTNKYLDFLPKMSKTIAKPVKIAGKTALQASVYIPGVMGATNVGINMAQDGLVEGLLNTQVSDIRNIVQASGAAKIHRRNVLDRRASEKYIKTVGDTPAKLSLQGKNAAYAAEGSDAVDLNTILSSKDGKGKVLKIFKKEYSEKQIDKIANILSKGDKSKVASIKETLVDTITNGTMSFSPSQGGRQVLVENPNIASRKDLKDFNRASKLLNRLSTNSAHWNYLKSINPANKTAPVASSVTPSTKINKVEIPSNIALEPLGALGPYKKVVPGINGPLKLNSRNMNKIPFQPKNAPTLKPGVKPIVGKHGQYVLPFKEGGVMKLRPGNKLSYKNPYASSAGNITLNNPYAPKKDIRTPINLNLQTPLNLMPKQGITLPSSNVTNNSGGSMVFPNLNPVAFKPKQYKDTYVLGETAKYLNSLTANSKNTRLKQQAAAIIPRRSAMSHQNINSNSDTLVNAHKMASDYTNKAGRIANLQTDVGMSQATRLEGQRHASDIVRQAKEQDILNNRQLGLQRDQMNQKVTEYNLGVDFENKARAAQGAQTQLLERANERTQNAYNFANYVNGLNHYAQIRPELKYRHDYLEEMNNPNLEKIRSRIAELPSLQKQSRELYDNYYKDLDEFENKKSYEDSDYGKEMSKYEDLLRQISSNVSARLNRYSRAMPMYSSSAQGVKSAKKGGSLTLEERKYLEDVKYENKRKLQDSELNFKHVLETSKMAQKSLIKIKNQ